MKTITEFSGTLLRDAARIRQSHRPPPAPKVAEGKGQGEDEKAEAKEEEEEKVSASPGEEAAAAETAAPAGEAGEVEQLPGDRVKLIKFGAVGRSQAVVDRRAWRDRGGRDR